MGICGISMAGGFVMTILGGEAGGWSSWGQRIGRRIDHGWVRVCESVVLCGFVCGGLVVFVHSWIFWWIVSISNS